MLVFAVPGEHGEVLVEQHEVGALVEAAIETEMRRLAPHRYQGAYEPLREPASAVAGSTEAGAA